VKVNYFSFLDVLGLEIHHFWWKEYFSRIPGSYRYNFCTCGNWFFTTFWFSTIPSLKPLVCFPQTCSSAGRMYAASRLHLHYYYRPIDSFLPQRIRWNVCSRNPQPGERRLRVTLAFHRKMELVTRQICPKLILQSCCFLDIKKVLLRIPLRFKIQNNSRIHGKVSNLIIDKLFRHIQSKSDNQY